MENASKALLIAGSILIAILLIAFGMKIFNSASEPDIKPVMDATSIATFNSKFTAYAGSNKSAAQVKSLANVVIANNATNELHQVSLGGSTDATTITNYVASLSGKYKVEITEYDNGYVKTIVISQ